VPYRKSKKQSDASSTDQKPPDEPTFFLDRNLAYKKFPTALRAAGIKVVLHDDYFPIDAKDVDWLPKVGQNGWIVLTKDDKIRYHALERQALMGSGVGAFILASGELTAHEWASIFIKALPAVKKFLHKTKRPFIARITRSGAISIVDKGTP